MQYGGLANHEILGRVGSRDFAKFVSVQAYYTIAGRDLEREVVPLSQDQKLGLMVWSPLAGGLFSGKYRGVDDNGPSGARAHDLRFSAGRQGAGVQVRRRHAPDGAGREVSVAQIALAWILSKPFVSTVIIGAKSMEQLRDNIAATRVRLTAEEINLLDEVSQLPQEYPGWMLALQGQYRAKPPFKD